MIPPGRRVLFSALLCSALARLAAQDVTITANSWSVSHDPPNELPVRKTAPRVAFPDELKLTPDIGYVVFDLMLDPKGKIIAFGPHATLAAYARAAQPNRAGAEYSWSPGKRNGKGVNTATTFAVIFNPATAAEKKLDASPRLLEVTLVSIKGPPDAKLRDATPDRVETAVVSVDEQGQVASVKEAPPGLERAFEIAAKNWRFAPARRGGAAVAAEVRMPFVVVTTDPASTSGKQVLPRVINQQPPHYPLAMRASNMRGEVLVDFVVDIEGRVRNPYVVRSLNPSFDDPAVEAVRQWRFEPGMNGGRPVNTHMQVPVVFTLDGVYDGGTGPMTEKRKADLAKLPEELRYDTPPQPRGTVRIVYPYVLLRAQKTGKASVNYLVGSKGDVIETSVRETSAPEFGLALQAAVECFTFEPALKGGRPGLALQGFQQEFNRSEEWQLVSDEDLALLRREERKPETILTLGDLDAPSRPLSRRPPQFPRSLAAKA